MGFLHVPVGEQDEAVSNVICWPARSAVLLLAGASIAAFGTAAVSDAGVTPKRVLAAMAGRMDGPALSPSVTVVSDLSSVFCTSPGNCWAAGLKAANGGLARVNQMLHWNGSAWRPFGVPEPGGTAKGDFNALNSVRCLNARDCWAVGTFLKGNANLNEVLHWNGTKWSRVSAPAPGGTGSNDMNELNDVTCVTSNGCWAVGVFGSFMTDIQENEALHWNGKKWSLVTTPDPAGTSTGDLNTLAAIRCTSRSNCLADGEYDSGNSTGVSNEVLRWNGQEWSLQATPNPAGTAVGDVNGLAGLACSSSASCWAVGADSQQNEINSLNDILHWNGKKWLTTKAPDPATGTGAGNSLLWDTCVSARDCWAVGWHGHQSISSLVLRNDTLHWNGVRWSHVSSPDPDSTAKHGFNILRGIRCTASANCWAVGEKEKGTTLVDEILHWNGQKWASVTVPSGGAGVAPSMDGRLDSLTPMMAPADVFAELYGVFCTSPGNCWAVGHHYGNGTATLNQMLRWNGSKWRPYPVPEPGGTAVNDYNALISVRCLNSGDCWAVGSESKGAGTGNQVLHWSGSKWSHSSAPTPGPTHSGDENQLDDVTCVSSADCWAVGYFGSLSSHTFANQAMRWNGKKWSLVTTPDPAGTATGDQNELNAIRCTSASACVADGYDGRTSSFRNEVLRWNGRKWSMQTTPNPGGTATGDASLLNGLACSSSTSCWAAGEDGPESPATWVNEMLHWNGKKWFTTKVPDPATGTGAVNDLLWDTCVSATDCWAVGYHGHESTTTFVFRNDTLHWNGIKWSHVSSPNPGGTATSGFNGLAGIRCTSATNCWAVGIRVKDHHVADEILHWNGTKWTSVDIAAG